MSHSRMRLGFSNLNAHLYSYNLVNSSNCEHCGSPENPRHKEAHPPNVISCWGISTRKF